MGYAVASAAARAGCEVTLLTGPVCLDPPEGCRVVRFVTVADLRDRLAEHFARADALVMSAAVGDFRVERSMSGKIHRSDGPVDLRLVPTEDVLADVARARGAEQRIVAFAVEVGDDEQVVDRASKKRIAKGADYIVANPASAMAAVESRACILGPSGVVLPWAQRNKTDLAEEIVSLCIRA